MRNLMIAALAAVCTVLSGCATMGDGKVDPAVKEAGLIAVGIGIRATVRDYVAQHPDLAPDIARLAEIGAEGLADDELVTVTTVRERIRASDVYQSLPAADRQSLTALADLGQRGLERYVDAKSPVPEPLQVRLSALLRGIATAVEGEQDQ